MALGNTAIRILVSVFAIPALVLLSYFGGVYFLSFVLIIAGISFYEFSIMVKSKGANVNVNFGLFAIIFLILNQYRFFFSQYNFLIGFFVILLLFELFRNNGSAIQNLGATLLGVFYMGIFGSTLIGIREFYPNINGMYYQGGYLIILAARPGMGKTALALQFLSAPTVKRHEAHEPDSTAIFSLEMQNRNLYARLIAQNTNIPLHNILKSGMNQYQLKEMLSKSELLGSELMRFDDTGGIKLFELVNKARKLKRDNNIELLVIDYIQLIENSVKGGNREQEVSGISRALKSLAKELDIPIIALAQLSRANEKRTDKTPLLSDLRESGSIEQDADIVMFLHRPEYYGIEQDEFGNSTVGKASLIFAKHRNGGLGVEDLNFDAQRTCFSDINIFSGAVNDVPY